MTSDSEECVAPSTSTISHAVMHAKSATYGPRGCCRRKCFPYTESRRSRDHRITSASVILLRRCLANGLERRSVRRIPPSGRFATTSPVTTGEETLFRVRRRTKGPERPGPFVLNEGRKLGRLVLHGRQLLDRRLAHLRHQNSAVRNIGE